jgi:5-formyltetrahydrofolate cyclo-ligase
MMRENPLDQGKLSNVQINKSDLRLEMAARRAALHAAQPLAGDLLVAHLPRLDAAPGIVSAYWPFRSEIDPRPLMRRFLTAGWRVALPVTPAKGAAEPLTFRLWTPEAVMAQHVFGMREPAPTVETVRPDLVLVPMFAFDRRGHRLGYGAGHYDRTLATLREQGPVRAIGLAFAGQEVDRLPTHDADQPLDAILTERGCREFANTAL